MDKDKDGVISREEFTAGLRHAPKALLRGATEHGGIEGLAWDLFSIIDKKNNGAIDFAQFLKFNFPKLSEKQIRSAIHYFSPPPPPPPPPKIITIRDVPGAQDDIESIFTFWDKKKQGVVRWSELSSPLQRCGIDLEAAEAWLSESQSEDSADLRRKRKSTVTQQDLESLFEDCYVQNVAESAAQEAQQEYV